MTTRTTLRPLATLAALLLALVALAGCSEDDPAAPAGPTHIASASDGALRLEVATDKASYGFAEPVTITMTLTNTGSTPVALDFFRGSPARYPNLTVNVDDADDLAHFVDGDGSEDQTTLAAGASMRATFTWDQTSRLTRRPVERGDFEVIGVTDFDDRDALRVDGLFIQLK